MSIEAEDNNSEGLHKRVTRQGEEKIGKLAQELLESAIVSRSLSAAFGTRERALRAQEAAMGALNLPSAGDVERLTRRLRSVSQRLEGIEDVLDRLDQRLEGLSSAGAGAGPSTADRLTAIEQTLARIEAGLPEQPSDSGAASSTPS